MNLDEIREIVAFMKENGLCELEYSEKHTSIKLKLAPPRGSHHEHLDHHEHRGHHGPKPSVAEEAPEAPVETEEAADAEFDLLSDEVKQAAADAAAAAAVEVRKAAVKAAAAVSETLKNSASYLKAKRDERLSGTPNTNDEEEFEDDFDDDEPFEAPVGLDVEVDIDEDEPVSNSEPVKLDTGAAKQAVKKSAETVYNTAKAGATLGKAGLRRGRTILTDLIKPKYDEEPEDIIPQDEDDETKTEE